MPVHNDALNHVIRNLSVSSYITNLNIWDIKATIYPGLPATYFVKSEVIRSICVGNFPYEILV